MTPELRRYLKAVPWSLWTPDRIMDNKPFNVSGSDIPYYEELMTFGYVTFIKEHDDGIIMNGHLHKGIIKRQYQLTERGQEFLLMMGL